MKKSIYKYFISIQKKNIEQAKMIILTLTRNLSSTRCAKETTEDTKECQKENMMFSQNPDAVKGSTTITASQIQRWLYKLSTTTKIET